MQPKTMDTEMTGGVLSSHWKHDFDFDRYVLEEYIFNGEVSQEFTDETPISKDDKEYETKVTAQISAFVTQAEKYFPSLVDVTQRASKRKK